MSDEADSFAEPALGANQRIGLALSGGGFRAAIFHAGILLRLAVEGMLERVSGISTVSGGSLLIALIMSRGDMKWPNSKDYQTTIFPEIRNVIHKNDLLTLGVGVRGFHRYWRHIVRNRAQILAESLRRAWKIENRIKDLPEAPIWWINTTCLETGKNWRFSKREMGDWLFGRHYDPPFLIAQAAAASAAVPYAIGALAFDLPNTGWYRTDPATRSPLERISPLYPTVRLWDGGAYENLGLEVMYKPQESLRGCDFLICSDASGPLQPPRSIADKLSALARGDLATPHLFDVASDQIRSLRSRMFMADVAGGRVRGALLRMGSSVREIHIKSGTGANELRTYDNFLPDDDVARAFAFPTALRAVTPANFDLIARHGYETADAVLTAHSSLNFKRSIRWTT